MAKVAACTWNNKFASSQGELTHGDGVNTVLENSTSVAELTIIVFVNGKGVGGEKYVLCTIFFIYKYNGECYVVPAF